MPRNGNLESKVIEIHQRGKPVERTGDPSIQWDAIGCQGNRLPFIGGIVLLLKHSRLVPTRGFRIVFGADIRVPV